MLAKKLENLRCCSDCCIVGDDFDDDDVSTITTKTKLLSRQEERSVLREFQERFENLPFGLFHWYCLFVFFVVGIGDGLFFEIHPFIFTSFERDLKTDEFLNGVIFAAMSGGVGLSAIFAGPLSDRVGRLPLMVSGFVLIIVFGALSSLVRSWEELAVLRFLSGLAFGLQRPVRWSLSAEFFPLRSRGKVM